MMETLEHTNIMCKLVTSWNNGICCMSFYIATCWKCIIYWVYQCRTKTIFLQNVRPMLKFVQTFFRNIGNNQKDVPVSKRSINIHLYVFPECCRYIQRPQKTVPCFLIVQIVIGKAPKLYLLFLVSCIWYEHHIAWLYTPKSSYQKV